MGEGREHTGELRNPPGICRPRSPQPGLFRNGPRVRCQQALSLAFCSRMLINQLRPGQRMPSVVSRGVRMPDVDKNIREGLTGLDVYYAYIKELRSGMIPTSTNRAIGAIIRRRRI